MIAAVSVSTFTVIGSTVVLLNVSVTPSTTSFIVLLGDVTGMSLMNATASAATCAEVAPPVAVCGFQVRPSSAPPPVVATEKAFAAPVSFERSIRRAPLASVRMLAVTLPPAALILSRSDASVSVASTVTSIAVADGSAASGFSMCTVPAFSVVVAPAGKIGEAIDCALASESTWTL